MSLAEMSKTIVRDIMRFLRPMINVYNVVEAGRHDVIYPQNFERVEVMG